MHQQTSGTLVIIKVLGFESGGHGHFSEISKLKLITKCDQDCIKCFRKHQLATARSNWF
jgi:hypothetical protein